MLTPVVAGTFLFNCMDDGMTNESVGTLADARSKVPEGWLTAEASTDINRNMLFITPPSMFKCIAIVLGSDLVSETNRKAWVLLVESTSQVQLRALNVKYVFAEMSISGLSLETKKLFLRVKKDCEELVPQSLNLKASPETPEETKVQLSKLTSFLFSTSGMDGKRIYPTQGQCLRI